MRLDPRALCGVGAVLALAIPASASFIPFTQITSNGPDNVAGQLFLSVSDDGGGAITMELSNVGTVDSTVKMWNIQDSGGVLDDLTAVTNGAGVDLVEDTPAGNLPSGSTVGFVSAFGVTATPPPAKHGVDPGETAWLTFSLASGKTYADVVSGFGSGAIRAGLHVISIGAAEESEVYVSGPPTGDIPTPGAVSLGIVAVALATSRRRR